MGGWFGFQVEAIKAGVDALGEWRGRLGQLGYLLVTLGGVAAPVDHWPTWAREAVALVSLLWIYANGAYIVHTRPPAAISTAGVQTGATLIEHADNVVVLNPPTQQGVTSAPPPVVPNDKGDDVVDS